MRAAASSIASGDAVEPPTHLRDRLGVGGVDREVRLHGPGPVHEQSARPHTAPSRLEIASCRRALPASATPEHSAPPRRSAPRGSSPARARFGHAASTAATSAATGRNTCSQLSSTTSSSLVTQELDQRLRPCRHPGRSRATRNTLTTASTTRGRIAHAVPAPRTTRRPGTAGALRPRPAVRGGLADAADPGERHQPACSRRSSRDLGLTSSFATDERASAARAGSPASRPVTVTARTSPGQRRVRSPGTAATARVRSRRRCSPRSTSSTPSAQLAAARAAMDLRAPRSGHRARRPSAAPRGSPPCRSSRRRGSPRLHRVQTHADLQRLAADPRTRRLEPAACALGGRGESVSSALANTAWKPSPVRLHHVALAGDDRVTRTISS